MDGCAACASVRVSLRMCTIDSRSDTPPPASPRSFSAMARRSSCRRGRPPVAERGASDARAGATEYARARSPRSRSLPRLSLPDPQSARASERARAAGLRLPRSHTKYQPNAHGVQTVFGAASRRGRRQLVSGSQSPFRFIAYESSARRRRVVRARERSDWWMRAREYFARLVGARTLRLAHTRHSVAIFVIRPFCPRSAPFALATRSGVCPVRRRFNLFNFFSPFFFFLSRVRFPSDIVVHFSRSSDALRTLAEQIFFIFPLFPLVPRRRRVTILFSRRVRGVAPCLPDFFFAPTLIFGVLLLCRRHQELMSAAVTLLSACHPGPRNV